MGYVRLVISADEVPAADDAPPASGLLPAAVVVASVFDASLGIRGIVSGDDGSQGLTPDALADEIARTHNLTTPDGWTEAMRALAGRREVLRRLTRALTMPGIPAGLFHAALKYVTENGVGRPIERHEHLHRGTILHAHITPPIQWTDDAPIAP